MNKHRINIGYRKGYHQYSKKIAIVNKGLTRDRGERNNSIDVLIFLEEILEVMGPKIVILGDNRDQKMYNSNLRVSAWVT